MRNWLLLIIFLLLLFFLRLKFFVQPQFISGTKIKITSILREEPKIIGQTQQFSLAGIQIRTWRYPEYHYGDRLEVQGTIKKGQIDQPEIVNIVGKSENRDPRNWVFSLRRKIEGIYHRILPEPQASLLSGIVLGSKSGMPRDFYEDLKKTGTLHVVVASGMNVTIVGSTLISFFILFFSRRWAVILSFLGIWFYVLLAGADSPVFRAGIMGSLAFLAQGLGREADAWRGLGIAAIFLLFMNPGSLFDLGFQLSFTATAGILFFGPRISNILGLVPKQIRFDLTQTLGAQIATFPLIWFNFGQYSAFSVLVNILVVGSLPWIMKLGALVAIAGLLFVWLGQILAWFLWPILTYFVEVIRLFSVI